jgi:hypothetical protein
MSVWGAVCPRPQGVILRESGVSSTPRPFDSITAISGILDHPLSRVMTFASETPYFVSSAKAPFQSSGGGFS